MVEQQLAERLQTFQSAPFLFVGSGLSRRYYDLPDWKGLLLELSSVLGVNYNEIASKENGDLPKIASTLSALLHPAWWNDDKFKESRGMYSSSVTRLDDVIKIEAARIIEAKNTLVQKYSTEIDDLKQVIIDGVITTNYDLLIESVFGDNLKSFIGQKSMIASPIQKIGEIYKIHGCISMPTSMILTSQDYTDFEQQNHYLSAILTQIFVEHPVIFLGYSIADKNIRTILSNVMMSLDEKLISNLANRLIFVNRQNDENSVESMAQANIYFSDSQISLPVTRIFTDDYSNVYRAMQNFERQIPLRILRLFKETAYNIAISKAPESKILLTDPALEERGDLQFVFGHGALIRKNASQKGIFGISREDIWSNLIGLDETYSSNDIFDALKKLTKSSAQFPLGKYFIETGNAIYKDDQWEISIPSEYTQAQSDRVIAYFSLNDDGFTSYKPPRRTLDEFYQSNSSIADVIRNFSVDDSLKRIAWLRLEHINADELKDFLTKIFGDQRDATIQSYFIKLFALYDFLYYIRPNEL